MTTEDITWAGVADETTPPPGFDADVSDSAIAAVYDESVYLILPGIADSGAAIRKEISDSAFEVLAEIVFPPVDWIACYIWLRGDLAESPGSYPTTGYFFGTNGDSLSLGRSNHFSDTYMQTGGPSTAGKTMWFKASILDINNDSAVMITASLWEGLLEDEPEIPTFSYIDTAENRIVDNGYLEFHAFGGSNQMVINEVHISDIPAAPNPQPATNVAVDDVTGEVTFDDAVAPAGKTVVGYTAIATPVL
jgi:hypothetical protein